MSRDWKSVKSSCTVTVARSILNTIALFRQFTSLITRKIHLDPNHNFQRNRSWHSYKFSRSRSAALTSSFVMEINFQNRRRSTQRRGKSYQLIADDFYAVWRSLFSLVWTAFHARVRTRSRENLEHARRELTECNFVLGEILPRKTRPTLLALMLDRTAGIYKTRPTIIVCPATYPRPNVIRRYGRESWSLYNKDRKKDTGRRRKGDISRRVIWKILRRLEEILSESLWIFRKHWLCTHENTPVILSVPYIYFSLLYISFII